MPVKKSGKKYTVKGEEYDSEQAANEAYKKYIAKAMGAPEEKKKKKSKEDD